MEEILKRTTNGFISFCTKCHAYHVEFGNLFFTFTEDEFEHFCQYINSIDGEYYQELNKEMKNARKIFLRMPVKGFYCALYPDELKLFTISSRSIPKFCSPKAISSYTVSFAPDNWLKGF